MRTINKAEAARLRAAGALLLDVRSAREFAAGHLPGSVSLPVERVGGGIRRLAGPERGILLYCTTGERSRTAAQVLRRLGYTKLYIVQS